MNYYLFIYYLDEFAREPLDILGFIRSILFEVQKFDRMNTLAYFSSFMSSFYRYDRNSIEKVIHQIDPSIINRFKKSVQESSGFITDKQRDYYRHYNKQRTPVSSMQEGTMLLDECEETALLIDEEETALLVEPEVSTIRAKMIRQTTFEEIYINKPLFEIGKQNGSDYRITDNNTVSRRHCQIEYRNEKFYILDLNSKNGTFVNGERINANTEFEIHDCDCLKFSNEEFVFNEGI